MAGHSPHVAAWKARLHLALRAEPQTTRMLSRATAIPAKTCARLLHELVVEQAAMKTTMRRESPRGFAPTGWYLRSEHV